jgi:hypothetical protein
MKMEDYDNWLESFELSLFEASERVRKARVEKSPICSGCRYRLQTYASPRCKVCKPTGTMFEAGEEGDDDE